MLIRCLTVLALGASGTAQALDYPLNYPESRRGDIVDSYHGTEVADPYRWLEDVDAPEVEDWVKAQNTLTRRVLDALPGREALETRLRALWNYEKFGVPERVGEYYYYRYNDGLRNQAQLVRQRGVDGPRELVLDPNTLSEDGTRALTAWRISPNGRYLAYGVAEAGSDWNRFFVRDLATGRDLPQVLERIKFSNLSWTHDSKGFFYSRYPQREGVFDELRDQALYYHRIGRPQARDLPVYAREDQPKWGFSGEVSDNGRYLWIRVWRGAEEENALYVRRLEKAGSPRVRGELVPVVTGFDAKYSPLGMAGSMLYLLTSDDAPRGRIVAVNLDRPQRFRPILAEGEDTIEYAKLVGGRLVVVVMRDAVHRLRVYGLDGVLEREIELPGVGSVSGIEGRPDSDELLLVFESFLQPERQLRVSVDSGRWQLLNAPQLPFEPQRYLTEQLVYTSKDGTEVPMFVTRRRDLDPERPHPTYLYGYGGFAISQTPWFSPQIMAWLDSGGVFAVPNLRGGGEYGEVWHRAGMRKHKQNVFDDFIAAAEALIKRGLTTPRQLAIGGRSNGGLLVGAVTNQRPGLFAAALPGVGVMDMLRYHEFTIGWAWTGEYGSSEEADMFPVLRAYSPYHNIRSGKDYPAVLITTADHDDRVVPGHSFKYTAALQHADTGPAPKLIRIETRAGHGRGTPTDKRIAEAVDRLAFMSAYTGRTEPERKRVRWRRLGGYQ